MSAVKLVLEKDNVNSRIRVSVDGKHCGDLYVADTYINLAAGELQEIFERMIDCMDLDNTILEMK